VPPATATAALNRLTLAGVIRGDPGQAMFAREQASSSQVLAILAVPALCRRLAAMPGTGPHADPAALQRVSEEYLSAGRRAIRSGLTEHDAHLVAEARHLLRAAEKITPPSPPRGRPRSAGGGTLSQGPAALDCPGTIADGIAAASARTAVSSRPAPRVPQRPRQAGRSA